MAPLGELARGRKQSERVRMSECSSLASFFSPCWPDRSGRCRRAAATRRAWRGNGRPWCARLASSNWLSGQLISHLCTIVTPNPCRISKKSITKNCRATRDLQLCLNELGLIRSGFQIAKLQSMVHETINQFLDLENFLSLKIASSWFLGAYLTMFGTELAHDP